MSEAQEGHWVVRRLYGDLCRIIWEESCVFGDAIKAAHKESAARGEEMTFERAGGQLTHFIRVPKTSATGEPLVTTMPRLCASLAGKHGGRCRQPANTHADGNPFCRLHSNNPNPIESPTAVYVHMAAAP